MPTLGEACQQLRIGRVTLAKWIKRLDIATTRHEWDYRYEVIAPEDVERIAEARRKLPTAQRPTIIPSYSALAFDRRQSEQGVSSEASPDRAPVSRQRPLQRGPSGALPDGMMSKEDASRLHGVPTSTLRRWCRDGRIETRQGTYAGEHGQYGIVDPLTRRGLAQFYALASGRPDFTPCAQCPHDSGGDAPEAAAVETPEE